MRLSGLVSGQKTVKRPLAAVMIIMLACAFLASCGKKGDPSLKAFEKPMAPSNLRAIHREDSLLLSWSYSSSKEGSIAEFLLLRSKGPDFVILAHIDSQERSFVVRDFAMSASTAYKIMARNPRGVFSDDSNILRLTPTPSPPAPTGLAHTVEGDSVVLTWSPAEEGLLYNVYRRSAEEKYGLAPVNPSPLSVNSFRHPLPLDRISYFVARALRGGAIRDEGPPSPEVAVNPFEDLVPSRPRGLKSVETADMIFLSWEESHEPWVRGFRIYRRMGTKDFALIGETQIPAFVDKEVSAGERDYCVTALGPGKEGPCAELKVRPPLGEGAPN